MPRRLSLLVVFAAAALGTGCAMRVKPLPLPVAIKDPVPLPVTLKEPNPLPVAVVSPNPLPVTGQVGATQVGDWRVQATQNGPWIVRVDGTVPVPIASPSPPGIEEGQCFHLLTGPIQNTGSAYARPFIVRSVKDGWLEVEAQTAGTLEGMTGRFWLRTSAIVAFKAKGC